MKIVGIRPNKRDLVSALIELGVNPYARDENGNYPFTVYGQDVLEFSSGANWLTFQTWKALQKWKNQDDTQETSIVTRKPAYGDAEDA